MPAELVAPPLHATPPARTGVSKTLLLFVAIGSLAFGALAALGWWLLF